MIAIRDPAVGADGPGGTSDGDGDGYGYGSGYGYGDGDGSGSGYGDGYGYGSGYGYGYGYGSGYGYGDGYGYGYGYGSGYGYGDGYGSGSGYGDGYGYGSGYGDGDGCGDGYGDGYGSGSSADDPSAEAYWARIAASHAPAGSLAAIWRSTGDGTPANGGSGTVAKPGLIETVNGPLRLCHGGTLHATWRPEKWQGKRFWIVVMHGDVAIGEHKIGALKREIVCELV